jgi:microsomal epoxide hydrolase
MSFSSLPSGTDSAVRPFTIETPQAVLDELKSLVMLSKIASATFENSQKDGKWGLDRERMLNIKDKWIEFDW